jgi:hypothetical protein
MRQFLGIKFYNEEPYVCFGPKWMDGYKGQKIIIIDDLDKQHCDVQASFLKLAADIYKNVAQRKGGTLSL